MQPSDRLRLKLNPRNVAVPQGFRDLYVDESGNLIQENPSGEKTEVGALPDVLTPDYITLSDQTGETIPDNSLGRKGSIPYFGNSPLVNGSSVVIDESMATTASPTRVELASFSIDADSMVEGAQYNFVANIYVDFLTDAPAAEDLYFQLDFGDQTGFTGGEGLVIPLTAARLQSFRLEGILLFADASGDIVISPTGVRGVVMNSSYGAASNSTLTGKVMQYAQDIIENAMISVPSGASNSIKLWVFNLTYAASKNIAFRGTASISSI